MVLSQQDSEAEDSLTRVMPARVGAALTNPGRVSTAGSSSCRWVVERTLAWITRRRRCVRDYERRHDSHEAMVRWAMISVMMRRPAKQAP